MDLSELFWSASLVELKNGYVEQGDRYLCLLCGRQIEKGIIYPEEGVLYEAEKYMRSHIERAHQSVFDYLIDLDKKLTGLTEHQKSLLRLFYQGRSDRQVQAELGIGSASTIRNHRFVLRERERQARLFLATMELLKEKDRYAPGFVNPHQTARMMDDRYNVTEDEREEILRKYFSEGTDGPLKSFPPKEKQRLVLLREIAGRFERGRSYREQEVNQILQAVYHDHVTLRRFLVEYGFLDRKPDGGQYWLKI